MTTELSRLSVVIDTLHHHIEGRRQKADRLEGRIEQAVHTLEERFGTYEEPMVSEEEMPQAIADAQADVMQLQKSFQESEREYQQYTKTISFLCPDRQIYRLQRS